MTWVVSGAIGCGPACEDVTQDAVDLALSPLESPTPCRSNDDCVNVSVNGSCFDVCTRAAHRSDAVDVQRAAETADAQICSDYTCTFVRPPCSPPLPALCLNEVCTEGIGT